MSSDNPTADRLLNDARKKSADQAKPPLALAGIGIGAVGVLLGIIGLPGTGVTPMTLPIICWVTGVIAAVLAVVVLKKQVGVKWAKLALVLGVASILVGTFLFTYYIA